MRCLLGGSCVAVVGVPIITATTTIVAVSRLDCNAADELGFGILVHNLHLNKFLFTYVGAHVSAHLNPKPPSGVRVGHITKHTCTGFRVYCFGT